MMTSSLVSSNLVTSHCVAGWCMKLLTSISGRGARSTKAFDTIKHSVIFRKLFDAKVSPIIARLPISIYRRQMANVSLRSSPLEMASPIRSEMDSSQFSGPAMNDHGNWKLHDLKKILVNKSSIPSPGGIPSC